MPRELNKLQHCNRCVLSAKIYSPFKQCFLYFSFIIHREVFTFGGIVAEMIEDSENEVSPVNRQQKKHREIAHMCSTCTYNRFRHIFKQNIERILQISMWEDTQTFILK